MGCWHRILLVVALVGATATACLVAPGAGADPIEDARTARAETQAAADTAAQRYTDALSEQARQEAEIARLAAEIPRLRARAEELRMHVVDRAVQLYQQGSPMPISRMVEAESVVDAARAINLTSNVATHDRDVASELTRTATQLMQGRTELKTAEGRAGAPSSSSQRARAARRGDGGRRRRGHNLEAVGFTQACSATSTGRQPDRSRPARRSARSEE